MRVQRNPADGYSHSLVDHEQCTNIRANRIRDLTLGCVWEVKLYHKG